MLAEWMCQPKQSIPIIGNSPYLQLKSRYYEYNQNMYDFNILKVVDLKTNYSIF